MNNKKAKTQLLTIILYLILPFISAGQSVEAYYNVLKQEGDNPVHFVEQKFTAHDLLIFDDALHLAVEPFAFYATLIQSLDHLDYVFLEVFSINAQPHLDAYFNSTTKDSTLLSPVFQNDFSGFGWRYETYYTLLSVLWDFNHTPSNKTHQIRVMGVDQPIYWEGIHSRQEYDIFQKSLVGRDYFMYKTILGYMGKFSGNKKGIFLTNTRHAYKNIKDATGATYWNCGTFFHQWHPGKTYSIRIHNITLSIESEKATKKNTSTEGMDRINYRWIRMENGLWDEAFKMNGNAPIAFSLKDNIFGKAKYVGNHMLNVYPDQTMYDAYDALMFLAPVNNLHMSAKLSFIYTEDFKRELSRRIRILYEDDIEGFLTKNNAKSIEAFIEGFAQYVPETKNELLTE